MRPSPPRATICPSTTLFRSCAGAVDAMHTGPRARYDRELFAQGVGNALCGLLGALPMTGVIVRSAANVEAGGRDRKSTRLNSSHLGISYAVFCLKKNNKSR